ncbi:MAG: 30S ribosomal protein S13 [Phycisphaerae bacterium]
MPRVAGVEIPDNKPIEVSLRYIYGIGPKNARDVLTEAGVEGQVRANKLTDEELSKISTIIDREYAVEGQLRRQIAQNISRLREIGCYRGMRHRRGMPVHGQRTRTNARTRKGPRKTVAGKKGVKEMHRG